MLCLSCASVPAIVHLTLDKQRKSGLPLDGDVTWSHVGVASVLGMAFVKGISHKVPFECLPVAHVYERQQQSCNTQAMFRFSHAQ